MGPTNGQVAAKLFVKSTGKHNKFLEAHGLEQKIFHSKLFILFLYLLIAYEF